MRLSTRGRYATRAMLDLALNFGQGPMQVRNIAGRQRVSGRYLEQLFIPLRKSGLITGLRGARGGFTLTRPPAEIRLSEIILAVEGFTSLVRCVDDPSICAQSNVCVTRNIWQEVGKAATARLESTTLQDLVEQRREKVNQEINLSSAVM